MAKYYPNPILTENDNGHLIRFNGLEISFIVKSHDLNGNPVLKVFDQWGNYTYIKGSDAYRYSYDYDKYLSLSGLYAFKSFCPEMERLQAEHIRRVANLENLSIDQAAKRIAEINGNSWRFAKYTINLAKE